MSDVQDMTSMMAKELMLGIRDNVEDIASAFKKMAIINPKRTVQDAEPKAVEAETRPQPEPTPVHAFTPMQRTLSPEKAAEFAALLEREQKKKRAKKSVVDENQLTMFGFVA